MTSMNKIRLSRIFIIVFHLVGFIGLSFKASSAFFIHLVPFHLLLMSAILLINQRSFDVKLLIAVITVMVSGFMVELIGVNTGAVFGEYTYGHVLGPKVAGVPLLIAVNWYMLIFSVGASIRPYLKHQHTSKALIGAVILVILDLFIEPVAVNFDYWRWADYIVPLRNYTSWFIVSFLLLRFYYAYDFHKTNKVAKTLFISQLLFFIGLNLTAV